MLFWIYFSEQLLKKIYSHYEKMLEIIEDSKEFSIIGKSSFGKIVIQIINRNYFFVKAIELTLEGKNVPLLIKYRQR